ncbi:hypothetical protein NXX60_05320 [Bacteroides thetaiotaomicron]|nr:hypothetical protein [Bacteroides thetaiotaomicron]UVQ23521.1 hypothetical protein NXX60_05320 [Bacteroides thetaiotaomicron]
MKKSQILMSLLLVILLSSCYASRITYENLSIIQRGMSSKEVIAIMGKPSYRSFDEESEMLEFRTSESSIAGVVNIWFVDDRVTKMKSYHTNGCMDRNRAIEDKEEEESAKKEKKEKEETSARIRVTTDGKHIIQTGSIIVTPDGKHETVVSDCGGVIITGFGGAYTCSLMPSVNSPYPCQYQISRLSDIRRQVPRVLRYHRHCL